MASKVRTPFSNDEAIANVIKEVINALRHLRLGHKIHPQELINHQTVINALRHLRLGHNFFNSYFSCLCYM